jgi:general secretion pathway protein E
VPDQQPVHNLHLEPDFPQEIDLKFAIKNYVLFTNLEGERHIALSHRYMAKALSFLAKFDFEYPIIFLDDDSFDRLYNKALELRTDKELSNLQKETDMEESEEELSLAEFLRTSSDLLTSEESAPIIKFVNALLYHAVKKRASDIHIEVHEHKGVVRFRIDGVLVQHAEVDTKIINLIISRIKVISNLDISEKRIPQDGRTQVKIAGKTLDIRVSVLPTYYGERVVMRILMESEDIPELQDLGFEEELTRKLDSLLQHSHGIILVTGPTGSGKSTTLHSFLQRIASPDKNIITIEDPVEYKADNINQIQVNVKAGLTFATGLRSILRQDPDIIMVGEIRDKETAQIATQAALTGHMVFSTLHTNTATGAITRLIDMGIEHYLIASSLLGVLAQRLVRKLCPHCKVEDWVAEEYAKEFNLPEGAKIYKANGCKECNYTGYLGRQAIGELFIMEDEFKSMLKEEVSDHEIRERAFKKGMKTIASQLKTLLLNGVTDMSEAVRIGLKD